VNPYGISFLNRAWDQNQGKVELWREVHRVLRPGGYIIAFAATRTYHRIATNLEDVGFEIRDMVGWIFSSGFPKAQDVGRIIQKRQGVEETRVVPKEMATGSACLANYHEFGDFANPERNQIVPPSPEAKKWAGWKTALKPALEPAVIARKPMEGSTADNSLEWETGALNIDGSRIGDKPYSFMPGFHKNNNVFGFNDKDKKVKLSEGVGRFPSNIIGEIPEKQEAFLLPVEDDFAHYAYVPKVGRAERNVGFDNLPNIITNGGGTSFVGSQPDPRKAVGNNHPTVKPISLMKYLITLVTVPGGRVLDPFMGSGSTGCAAKELGMEFTGIDLNPDYVEISRKRIAAWNLKAPKGKKETVIEKKEVETDLPKDLFE